MKKYVKENCACVYYTDIEMVKMSQESKKYENIELRNRLLMVHNTTINVNETAAKRQQQHKRTTMCLLVGFCYLKRFHSIDFECTEDFQLEWFGDERAKK